MTYEQANQALERHKQEEPKGQYYIEEVPTQPGNYRLLEKPNRCQCKEYKDPYEE